MSETVPAANRSRAAMWPLSDRGCPEREGAAAGANFFKSRSGTKRKQADAARTSKAAVNVSGEPPVTKIPAVFPKRKRAIWTAFPKGEKMAARRAEKAKTPPLKASSGETRVKAAARVRPAAAAVSGFRRFETHRRKSADRIRPR